MSDDIQKLYGLQLSGKHQEPFVWNGQVIASLGDMIESMLGILHHGTKEEAQRYITEWRRVQPDIADSNAGFTTGEFGHDDRHKAYDWFGVEHPILGTKDYTFNELMQKGGEFMRGEFSK